MPAEFLIFRNSLSRFQNPFGNKLCSKQIHLLTVLEVKVSTGLVSPRPLVGLRTVASPLPPRFSGGHQSAGLGLALRTSFNSVTSLKAPSPYTVTHWDLRLQHRNGGGGLDTLQSLTRTISHSEDSLSLGVPLCLQVPVARSPSLPGRRPPGPQDQTRMVPSFWL